MNSKISILTGAGASRSLGYPLAEDIHYHLLEDKELCRYTGGNYFFTEGIGFHTPESRKQTEQVRSTIRAIRVLCDSYHWAPTNYEDWFYIMDQVYRALSGDLDNLLVSPFIAKLAEILPKDILAASTDSLTYMNYNHISTRCEEGCKMITDVVREKLAAKPQGDLSIQLPWLNDLLQDSEISVQALMTLNQDKVLEQFLDSKKVLWTDGFAKKDLEQPGASVWDSAAFESDKLPLLKLHGSIDWRVAVDMVQNNTQTSRHPRKVLNYKADSTVKWFGQYQSEDILFLIGRHNKALSYSAPLFNELHSLANEALKQSDVLVVVGYSYMDKFINRMILNWLYSGETRKLVTVNPNSNQLINSARPAIAISMGEIDERSDLKIISEYSEKLKWSNLKEVF